MKAIDILRDIWNGFDLSGLWDILLRVIPALICITLHELSHGLVAYALGDDTAKRAGRLTLDPLKHLDPMGLLMMVIFRFGYAKPVPVDMRKFRDPRSGMALTALAGPVSNVLIAAIFLFLYGLLTPLLYQGAVGSYVLKMLFYTAELSLVLAIFNLIPIPPLDGSKVLFSLLPDRAYMGLMRYERYGTILMIALVMFGALNGFLSTAISWVMGWMWPVAEGAFDLGMSLFGGA
ncbi:MAG: site-2 protease family protein [Oscillospiraceae bacterium]|nr:site-2 protease family protein [Oscillospiraceae bacterium]